MFSRGHVQGAVEDMSLVPMEKEVVMTSRILPDGGPFNSPVEELGSEKRGGLVMSTRQQGGGSDRSAALCYGCLPLQSCQFVF